MERRSTRQQVQSLLEAGKTTTEIARLIGVTKQAVSYHRRRLGAPVDERCNRRYDWEEVQRYYDLGNSKRDCQKRFGFAAQTWHAAVKRKAITARPHKMPLDQLLGNVKRGRYHLKLRLIGEGLLEPCCEECGIDEWRNAPLSLELHHRNGDGLDNRLENLSLLCPNCHSQTDTWGGRNRQRLEAVS